MTSPEQLIKLTAADAAVGDRFGVSVSTDGLTTLIGMYSDDDQTNETGSAYLSELQADGSWSEPIKLEALDAEVGDRFGREIAVYGDIAAVGAYLDDHGGGTDSGSVYIFQKQTDGSWVEIQKLTASDANSDDYYGRSVAIGRDTMVVGAYQEGDPEFRNRSLYIYKRQTNGTWLEVAKVTAPDSGDDDTFGYDVAIYDDILAVGAPRDGDNGADSGAVYLFKEQTDGSWTQVAKLQAADGAVGDLFGYSVAIGDSRVVVGASSADDGTEQDKGAAYVFEAQGDGSWIETAKLLGSTAGDGDRFGQDIALDGDSILVGAYLYGQNAGAAYLYEYQSDGSWQETSMFQANDTVANDGFGQSVAMADGTIVVGAYGDADAGEESGSAYIFSHQSVSEPSDSSDGESIEPVVQSGDNVAIYDSVSTQNTDISTLEASDTPGAPVRVEMEDYINYSGMTVDNAGNSTYRQDDVDIYTTTDSSGHVVGGLKDGASLEYSLTLPQTGEYNIVVRAASPKSLGQSLDITVGGQTYNLPIVATGGWQAWQDFILTGVPLSEGSQTLHLGINSKKFQLNYIDFIPVSPPTAEPGAIAFDSSSYTVAEDGGTATINVVRTGGMDGDVTVDIALTDGSATAPDDYINNGTQTLTFAAGIGSQPVEIPIVDDVDQEGDETIELAISNVEGGATLGSQTTATLTISDNETALDRVRVEAEDYTDYADTTIGNEGGVYRNDDVDLYETPDASIVYVGSIKKSGEYLDYEVTLPGTPGSQGTFDVVMRVASAKDFVHRLDLDIDGQTYTFNFGITGSSGDAWTDVVLDSLTLPTGTQTFRVTPKSKKFNLDYIEFIPTDESAEPVPGEIAFESSIFTVNEGAGTATITLMRTGGDDGRVSIDLDLTDGSAEHPNDYTHTSTHTVTFEDGITTQTITVPIIDDELEEGNETVNLILSNVTGGATIGNNSSATLTIQDNDTIPVSEPIRIMPLGDSITYGVGTDWNGDGIFENEGGYRIRLENLFANNNIPIDFVGSKTGGPPTLSDQDNEGHPGYKIDQVSRKARSNSWFTTANPDVVLLMLGTNGMNDEDYLETAPGQLGTLIDQILTDVPDAHVIVSTIPTTTSTYRNPIVDAYNEAISSIVTAKISAGQNVRLVDIHSVISMDEMADKLHPSLEGYNDAAAVWFDGVLDILDNYGDFAANNDDVYVEAAISETDNYSTSIQASLVNASESTLNDLSFRYFMNLSELSALGYTSDDVVVGNTTTSSISDLTLWDDANDIYYVDVDLSGVAIAPNTSALVEFTLGVNSLLPSTDWDQTNDWSAQSLTLTRSQTRYIPVYDSSSIVSGVIPA